MQRIAIYDMDKTITRKATFGPFLAYAVVRYRPVRALLAPILIFTVLAYAAGLIDRGRLKEINLSLMLGPRIDAEALRRISARFAGRMLARNVFRSALDQMDKDRADGCRIVIASASYEFYVAQVGRLLGAEVIATRATPSGEAILPTIAGDNCYGEEKLAMVLQWFAQQSLRRESVHVRFYSDHASDVPCLAWADEAFATNPHAKLRAIARSKGWHILDWAN